MYYGLVERCFAILILGIGILVAVFLFRTCFNRWMEKQMDPPPPMAFPGEDSQ